MVEIKNIIRRINQGATGPYLCEGSDKKLYIVKGHTTTYKGLIYEWVCGSLAKKINLPVPDFRAVYIDRELIQYSDYELHEGEWFASEYQHNIQDVTYSSLEQFGEDNLNLLFVFDYWINNGDRTLTVNGGNPNLFLSPISKVFFVLDHNLAFDVSFEKCFTQNKLSHLGATSWYATQMDLYKHQNYQTILKSAFTSLDQILDTVPKEWVENSEDSSILDNIKLILSRYETQEFWEGIK